jgi:hypothetical protein
MPKVFLRLVVSEKTRLKAYEVVDGQQRLKAILDFYDGTLKLSKDHNHELGGVSFEGLPEPVQRNFLEYQISTEVMEEATDSEVWAMFERLNTYTLALNPQEHRNARFFGPFKQTAYRLAADQVSLDAWKQLNVFSDRQISRMKEVEWTSDVLVAIVNGISDINTLTQAYEDYDERFPKQKESIEAFRGALEYVLTLSEAVSVTRFRRRSWFYSLMVAVTDSIYGIPKGLGPKKPAPSREVVSRMFLMHEALSTLVPPRELARLHGALSRGTSHVPERKLRHDYFFEMLTLSQGEWDSRWQTLSKGMRPKQTRFKL